MSKNRIIWKLTPMLKSIQMLWTLKSLFKHTRCVKPPKSFFARKVTKKQEYIHATVSKFKCKVQNLRESRDAVK